MIDKETKFEDEEYDPDETTLTEYILAFGISGLLGLFIIGIIWSIYP